MHEGCREGKNQDLYLYLTAGHEEIYKKKVRAVNHKADNKTL